MRCVAALVVVVFVAVECMPAGLGGLNDVTVPTSPDGDKKEGAGVSMDDGTVKVTKKNQSHTDSASESKQHEEKSFDHTSGDGSSSVSAQSEQDKEHTEKKSEDKSETETIALSKDGIKNTKKTKTETDEQTHDKENDSSTYKATNTGANSNSTVEGHSEHEKEKDVHDHKVEEEEKQTNIGLGKMPTQETEKKSSSKHDEHTAESGKHVEHRQEQTKDGNKTTRRDSVQGGEYSQTADNSTSTDTHTKEKTAGDGDKDAQEPSGDGDKDQEEHGHQHHHHRHGRLHHIPRQVFKRLNEDSRRLGLTRGPVRVTNKESFDNNAHPEIRREFLLAVAQKIHNAKINGAHGKPRTVLSHHSSDEYGNIGSPFAALSSQYFSLAQKIGFSPVSSHFANTKMVEAKFANPFLYGNTGYKYKQRGTGLLGAGNTELENGNTKYGNGKMQLRRAEWGNSRIDTGNKDNYGYESEINGGRFNYSVYGREAFGIPDIKNVILSQNMDVLKKRDEHLGRRYKDVLNYLNGHNRSVEANTSAPRTIELKRKHTGDVSYSNVDNEITRRKESKGRYRKIKNSLKNNGFKADFVDSYSEPRESYINIYNKTEHGTDKVKVDGSNDKSRVSNDASKRNDENIESYKNEDFNDFTKQSDNKQDTDSSNKTVDSNDAIKYDDVKIDSDSSNYGSNTSVNTESSSDSVKDIDLNFGDGSNGNGVDDSSVNMTPKINHIKSIESSSFGDSGSQADNYNLESSTDYEVSNNKTVTTTDASVNHVSQNTNDESYNYDAKSDDLDKYSVVKTDDHEGNDNMIVDLVDVDSEVRTKSEKYSQDTSDTDSVTIATNTVPGRFDGTNETSTTSDNADIVKTDDTGDSDAIAKETSDIDIGNLYDSTSNTTVDDITNASDNTTEIKSTDKFDDNLNESDSTTSKATEGSETNAIDVTKTPDTSTEATFTDISDTTIATALLDADTTHSSNFLDDKTVLDMKDATGKSNMSETSNSLDDNSNNSDTITNEANATDINDSIANTTEVNTTNASGDFTDSGTVDISYNHPNNYNATNAKETSELDIDNIYVSNSDTTVIGLTYPSDNLTDIETTNSTTAKSIDSDKEISKELAEPHKDNYFNLDDDSNKSVAKTVTESVIGDLDSISETTVNVVSIENTNTTDSFNEAIAKEVAESNRGDNDSNFDTNVISISKASDNSSAIETSDEPDKTVAKTVIESEIDDHDSASNTTVIGMIEASENLTEIEATNTTDVNSNDPDKAHTDAETNRDDSASNLETNVIGISKTSNLTDRETSDDSDKTVAKTVTESDIGDHDSTSETTVNVASNENNNTSDSFDKAIAKEVAQPNRGDSDSNLDTNVIGISKTSSNLTDVETLDKTDGNSDNSVKNSPKAATESDDSDIPLTRTAKSIEDPTDTPFADGDVADSSIPSIATIPSDSDASYIRTDSIPTDIKSAPGNTNSTAVPEFYANNESTNVTSTAAVLTESVETDGIVTAHSEANAISTAEAIDGSNNSTTTAEARASSDDSDASVQVIAIADANVNDSGVSSDAVAIASSAPEDIAGRSDDANNPSDTNSLDNPVTDMSPSTDKTANATADGPEIVTDVTSITSNSADVTGTVADTGPSAGNLADATERVPDTAFSTANPADAISDGTETVPDVTPTTSNSADVTGTAADTGPSTVNPIDATSDVTKKEEDTAPITGGLSNPNPEVIGDGNTGTPDNANIAVATDLSTANGPEGGSGKNPPAADRTVDDQDITENSITVVKPVKSKARKEPNRVRDVDATESKSDETGSSSDERPIFTGLDSPYDSRSSMEDR